MLESSIRFFGEIGRQSLTWTRPQFVSHRKRPADYGTAEPGVAQHTRGATNTLRYWYALVDACIPCALPYWASAGRATQVALFPPSADLLQTPQRRSQAVVRLAHRRAAWGGADQQQFPSMFAKYHAVVDVPERVHHRLCVCRRDKVLRKVQRCRNARISAGVAVYH